MRRDRIREVHIDDPWSDDPRFGGDEPIPDDETGKDQGAKKSMTMESLRSLVRSFLR